MFINFVNYMFLESASLIIKSELTIDLNIVRCPRWWPNPVHPPEEAQGERGGHIASSEKDGIRSITI